MEMSCRARKWRRSEVFVAVPCVFTQVLDLRSSRTVSTGPYVTPSVPGSWADMGSRSRSYWAWKGASDVL